MVGVSGRERWLFCNGEDEEEGVGEVQGLVREMGRVRELLVEGLEKD